MPIKVNKFDGLRKLWNQVSEHKEEILTQAVEKVLEEYRNRIFERGEDSDGDQIGTYATKKIAIMKDKMVNPSAKTDQLGYDRPKTAKLVFAVIQRYAERIEELDKQIKKMKDGKTKEKFKARLRRLEKYKAKLERKTKIKVSNKGKGLTAYFRRGYKQFRAVQGLKNDRVYLKYSGYFYNCFSAKFESSGAQILLADNTQLPIPPGLSKHPPALKLAKHFEKKYRTRIFDLTKEEDKLCWTWIANGVKKALNEYANRNGIQLQLTQNNET
jgi:hypothetical protein